MASFFQGFERGAIRRFRVTSWTLVGTSRSEVLDCTVEVEHDDGRLEERTIKFAEPFNLASFEALVASANKWLSGQ
jgi:hypothetical protein